MKRSLATTLAMPFIKSFHKYALESQQEATPITLAAGAQRVVLCGSPVSTGERLMPTEPEGLVGHWKFQGNCKDYSGNGNHGTGRNVTFGEGPDGSARGAAVLNSRDSSIEVPDAESLHLGRGEFSLSVWVKPEVPMRGIFGDIVSKFDAQRRRGINFHIAGSSSGYTSMCDARHVHFGIDDGYLGHWEDCGKPCDSNSLVTCLVVFEGQLYCGIADAKNLHDAAHVFRWAGGTQWIDCGRLGNDPNHISVQSMIVHQGKLYAGTGIWDWVRARGDLPGKPPAAKPRVFFYEGGTRWRDLGQVGETSRVLCMASFQGDLYSWDLSRRHLQHRLALSLASVWLKSGGKGEEEQLGSLAEASSKLRDAWSEHYREVFTPRHMEVELDIRFDAEPGIIEAVRGLGTETDPLKATSPAGASDGQAKR
jgi:hypothetical protein